MCTPVMEDVSTPPSPCFDEDHQSIMLQARMRNHMAVSVMESMHFVLDCGGFETP